MDAAQVLASALDVGEQMLTCGGEIGRVEDTIERILRAYGARRSDIFTITSSIVVTLDMDGAAPITQTRRIYDQRIDLDRLDRVNALSRTICRETPEPAAIRAALDNILRAPTYARIVQYAVYAATSSAFSIFFGGSLRDAAVSAVIGLFMKWLINLLDALSLNKVLLNAVYAFAGGAVAALAVLMGLGEQFDKIAIGNIMLLIPGLQLTNALRDMLSGDTISGMTRLIQAALIAIAVATGFALTGGWIK